MDAGGPCHLRKTLHGRFYLLAGNQHQIGHLVDHHYNEGQRCQIQHLFLMHGLARLLIKSGLYAPCQNLVGGTRLSQPLIVAGDVPDSHLGHVAIPAFHFPNRPFQRRHRLGGVRNYRTQQMWDAIID